MDASKRTATGYGPKAYNPIWSESHMAQVLAQMMQIFRGLLVGVS